MLALPLFLTSCEDILGEWSRPAPAVVTPVETPAATVTTAPTATTGAIFTSSTTALVTAGVADGGTMMYKVTTTNTQPTSTDGFSETVPTAETLTDAGTYYVWYYAKASDASHTDSEISATPITVTVTIGVTSITLNKTAIWMSAISGSETLTVTTVAPDDATDKSVTWSSSKTSVATVDETTGKVTGVAAGSAVITATANDGSGVKATCNVTVGGLLSGKFQINAGGTQVQFSQGNLCYSSGTWGFFDNQYGYYSTYSADSWDKFGWSTAATTYGMNTSTTTADYSGDFVDWGNAIGTGWRTLTYEEWKYMFDTRTTTSGVRYAMAKVNGVGGVILLPDDWSTSYHALTSPNGNTEYTTNQISLSDWTNDFEAHGAVFLTAAGNRDGTAMNDNLCGYYWSSTLNGTNKAHFVYIQSGNHNFDDSWARQNGLSVRLVR